MGSDIHGAFFKKAGDTWTKVGEFEQWRNYDSFAVLGDVRNGTGFGGCKTGEGFNSIAPDRDLPDGFPTCAEGSDSWCPSAPNCDSFARCNDYIWLGDHSRTYMTVRELLEFDWLQTTLRYGVVTINEYETLQERRKWNKNARPDGFSAEVCGFNTLTLEQDDYVPGVDNKVTHVRAKWETTYWATCGLIREQIFPNMLKAAKGDFDNTYLVIGFDS